MSPSVPIRSSRTRSPSKSISTTLSRRGDPMLTLTALFLSTPQRRRDRKRTRPLPPPAPLPIPDPPQPHTLAEQVDLHYLVAAGRSDAHADSSLHCDSQTAT